MKHIRWKGGERVRINVGEKKREIGDGIGENKK